MQLSADIIEEIKTLCLDHRVKSLDAFGSVTGADFGAQSDIDLLVDFYEQDPFLYADLYFSLKEKLETLLHRQVDLLEVRGMRNNIFRKVVDETKVAIY